MQPTGESGLRRRAQEFAAVEREHGPGSAPRKLEASGFAGGELRSRGKERFGVEFEPDPAVAASPERETLGEQRQIIGRAPALFQLGIADPRRVEAAEQRRTLRRGRCAGGEVEDDFARGRIEDAAGRQRQEIQRSFRLHRKFGFSVRAGDEFQIVPAQRDRRLLRSEGAVSQIAEVAEAAEPPVMLAVQQQIVVPVAVEVEKQRLVVGNEEFIVVGAAEALGRHERQRDGARTLERPVMEAETVEPGVVVAMQILRVFALFQTGEAESSERERDRAQLGSAEVPVEFLRLFERRDPLPGEPDGASVAGQQIGYAVVVDVVPVEIGVPVVHHHRFPRFVGDLNRLGKREITPRFSAVECDVQIGRQHQRQIRLAVAVEIGEGTARAAHVGIVQDLRGDADVERKFFRGSEFRNSGNRKSLSLMPREGKSALAERDRQSVDFAVAVEIAERVMRPVEKRLGLHRIGEDQVAGGREIAHENGTRTEDVGDE